MTGFLLGGILIVGLVAIGEGYVIFGRMQLFLTAAEQILVALHVPLRQVPSKSAPRTIAAAGIRPRPWFQMLRRLSELHVPVLLDVDVTEDVAEDQAVDDELGRWADDGGPEPDDLDDVDDAPTDVFPTIDPPTVPTGLAIDVWQHTGIPARTQLDDEPWRDRFDFSGGRRHRPTRTDGGD